MAYPSPLVTPGSGLLALGSRLWRRSRC